mgnify:CR=1 FL=1
MPRNRDAKRRVFLIIKRLKFYNMDMVRLPVSGLRQLVSPPAEEFLFRLYLPP